MQLTLNDDIKIFTAMKSIVHPLKVVCGWCPDAREKTVQLVRSGFTVSHGMCPACVEKFEAGQ